MPVRIGMMFLLAQILATQDTTSAEFLRQNDTDWKHTFS